MIRGTKRPVQQRTIDLRASIHNRFDIEVLDAKTGELKQTAQAFNLICDAFWTRLFNVSNGYWIPLPEFMSILYGGGSGTPSASDTELFDQLGYRNDNSSAGIAVTFTADKKSGIITAQAVGVLQAEDNVGDTITEVGIGYDTSHCITHAMLTDMNGNPISIEKTDTDVIKIYATFYIHWPSGGWYNGSVMMLSGYEIVSSAISLASSILKNDNRRLALRREASARCTGISNARISENVSPTVTSAAKTVSYAMRYAAAQANLPIRSIYIQLCRIYNGGFTYAPLLMLIPGTWYSPSAITGEAIGTGDGSTVGFNTAFPVGTVGTVYVNGAAASGATMRKGPADGTMMHQWFNQLAASDAAALTNANTPIYLVPEQTGGASWSATDSYWFKSLQANEKTYAFENPYSTLGIAKFIVGTYQSAGTITAQASDDLTSWTDCGSVTLGYTAQGEIAVPNALRKKKYFRFSRDSTGSFRLHNAYIDGAEHNITFATAPASGAVITADYTPDCIPKDENHVFDLNIALTFGELQEA